MSSPFSKAFNAKNPVTPLQGNAFIKAKMDAEAAGKKSFVVDGKSHPIQMEGSPYHKHGKLEKKLKKAEAGKIGAEQGDKDYELIAAIKKEIKEAKAAHKSERRESDDAQIREDEDAARGAAVEMAPLKKNISPLDMGGYRGGGDVGTYASTADLYQNMFNKVESATKQFIAGQENPDYEGKAERQANRVARREERSKKKQSRGKDTTKFDEKTAFISAKSTTNREMANKEKESEYNKLASIMSDEDKKKYGITT